MKRGGGDEAVGRGQYDLGKACRGHHLARSAGDVAVDTSDPVAELCLNFPEPLR